MNTTSGSSQGWLPIAGCARSARPWSCSLLTRKGFSVPPLLSLTLDRYPSVWVLDSIRFYLSLAIYLPNGRTGWTNLKYICIFACLVTLTNSRECNKASDLGLGDAIREDGRYCSTFCTAGRKALVIVLPFSHRCGQSCIKDHYPVETKNGGVE